jgi:hypothetical protein
MSSSSPAHNKESLLWLSGRPIQAVSFLLSLYLIAAIGIAFLLAIGRQDVIQIFIFNSKSVAHGELWRLVTYNFVNPPSIWFGLQMAMFFFFGSLIESANGCRTFAIF